MGSLLLLLPPPAPDILIERAGANVAIRNPDGQLVPAFPNRARFTVEKWLQVNGEEEKPAGAAKRPGWTCRENRCTATVKGKRIAYVTRAEGKPIDCSGTDILITDFPLRGSCRTVATRIDRFDLWKSGAHALRIGPEGLSIETARAAQGSRPWVVTPERRATPYIARPPKQDVRQIDGTGLSRQEATMPKISQTITMSDIRKEIDRIDESLIKQLAERQRWVEKAVVVKKRDGLPARDDARIRQVIDHVRVLARAHKVDPALVEAMWTEMVEWFVAYEERSI